MFEKEETEKVDGELVRKEEVENIFHQQKDMWDMD